MFVAEGEIPDGSAVKAHVRIKRDWYFQSAAISMIATVGLWFPYGPVEYGPVPIN